MVYVLPDISAYFNAIMAHIYTIFYGFDIIHLPVHIASIAMESLKALGAIAIITTYGVMVLLRDAYEYITGR